MHEYFNTWGNIDFFYFLGKWYGFTTFEFMPPILIEVDTNSKVSPSYMLRHQEEYIVQQHGGSFRICNKMEDIFKNHVQNKLLPKSEITSEYNIQHFISYCETENLQYAKYKRHDVFCVVAKIEEGVRIIGRDGQGIYHSVKFPKAKEWYRLSHTVNTTIYNYPFCIIDFGDYSALFCMNTFVIKPIVYESIVPTDFRTHSFDYLNSADRTIPVVSRQHVWVDNCLYNSNLEECVEISDSYDILNVYGEYVVVKRRADNFLFFLQIDWQTYKVTELSYYCKLLEGHRIALCFNDWGTIENYDPIANRFLVDMDALEEERKRAQSRHFYDSYTVADAFDDDPEAYWNID